MQASRVEKSEGERWLSLASSAKSVIILAALLIPIVFGLDILDSRAVHFERPTARSSALSAVLPFAAPIPALGASTGSILLDPASNAPVTLPLDRGDATKESASAFSSGADSSADAIVNESGNDRTVADASIIGSGDSGSSGAQGSEIVPNVESQTLSASESESSSLAPESSGSGESEQVGDSGSAPATQISNTNSSGSVPSPESAPALTPSLPSTPTAPPVPLANRDPFFTVNSPGWGGGFSGGGGGGGAPAPVPEPEPEPEPTAPTAPQSPAAVRSSGEVALSWLVPESDGGAAVSDYSIRFSTDNFASVDELFDDGIGTDLFATVSTITNGIEYFFKILAVNSVGTGPASSVVSATPAGLPAPVSDLAAVAGDGEATLSWTAPDANGSALTGYDIFYSADNFTSTTTFAGIIDPNSTNVTGLTNNTGYSFKVFAINVVGTSAVSNVPTATPVAPASVPATITDLAGEDNETDGEVILTWSVPADGGSAITGYEVLYSANDFVATTTWAGAVDPAGTTVDGLDNGTPYKFKVHAENGIGKSEDSNVVELTPTEEVIPGSS